LEPLTKHDPDVQSLVKPAAVGRNAALPTVEMKEVVTPIVLVVVVTMTRAGRRLAGAVQVETQKPRMQQCLNSLGGFADLV
jgi:hypothetical protein